MARTRKQVIADRKAWKRKCGALEEKSQVCMAREDAQYFIMGRSELEPHSDGLTRYYRAARFGYEKARMSVTKRARGLNEWAKELGFYLP